MVDSLSQKNENDSVNHTDSGVIDFLVKFIWNSILNFGSGFLKMRELGWFALVFSVKI